MIPYLIPLIITLLAAIAFDGKEKMSPIKTAIWAFLFVYLTCLVGLRYEVGGDTITYMAVYEWARPLSTWEFDLFGMYQPGYTFLCAITKSISEDFTLFQFFHAFIINAILFRFIRKHTKYIFTSLFVLEFSIYIYFTTEILREVLAIAVFLLNYKNYEQKKWLKYYIGAVLSCLFHFSAIILFIIPFLNKIRFNKKFIALSFVSLGLLYFAGNVLSHFGGSYIIDKFNSYWGGHYGYLVTFLYFLRNAVFPLFFAWIIKFKFKQELKFENIICIMILFGIGSAINPLIWGRTVNYFMIFFCISFGDYCGQAMKSANKRIHNNAWILLVFFLITYSTYYLSIKNYMRYIPYCSVMNPHYIERDNLTKR